MRTLGIVIIIVGILMIVFTSINFQTKKKVMDIGSLQINKRENHRVRWPVYTVQNTRLIVSPVFSDTSRVILPAIILQLLSVLLLTTALFAL
jgi:hypothetical protein